MNASEREKNASPQYVPSAAESHPQFFALLEKMTEKLHQWIDCASIPILNTSLGLVQMCCAVRTWNLFRSIKQLLANNHWEDATILARSLFELLLNVEEIHRDESEMEQKAARFLLYNELQDYRHLRALREYQIETGRLPNDDPLRKKLNDAARKVFAPFLRKTKQGNEYWLRHWSGKNIRELAEMSSNPIRMQHYKVLYSYQSAFAHSSPMSVMSTHTTGKDWEEIKKARDQVEEEQTLVILSFTVIFTLEILLHVGRVLPDYDVAWNSEVLTDLYHLHGTEPPPMPQRVREAIDKLKRGAVNKE